MQVDLVRDLHWQDHHFAMTNWFYNYMHIGNWIETIDDNVRIAKAVDRRNVGVMFHLHHWQAVGNRDLEKLHEHLAKAQPYLMIVVMQGTDKDKATHKILGEGSFDMVPLVRTLREINYQGRRLENQNTKTNNTSIGWCWVLLRPSVRSVRWKQQRAEAGRTRCSRRALLRWCSRTKWNSSPVCSARRRKPAVKSTKVFSPMRHRGCHGSGAGRY
jgi:hypothetical protein